MKLTQIFIPLMILLLFFACEMATDSGGSGGGGTSSSGDTSSLESSSEESSEGITNVDQKSSKKIDYNSLERYGIEADSVEGTWYQDDKSIYTYDSVIVSFNFPNLEPGKYQIILTGKCWTPRTTQSELKAGFNEYIINVSTDYNLSGNIEIPASVNEWQDGSIIFDLTGPTIFYIQWMNPEVGVNFQLLKILLVKIEDASTNEGGSSDEGSGEEDPCNIKGNSLVRHGKDACSVEGKWHKDANTIFTYQAGKYASFRYNDLPAGEYEIRVMAKYRTENGKKGTALKDFDEYQVKIESDGVFGEMTIPASSTSWEKGEIVLNLKGGKTDITVTWLNGKDSINFQIHSIKLKKN